MNCKEIDPNLITPCRLVASVKNYKSTCRATNAPATMEAPTGIFHGGRMGFALASPKRSSSRSCYISGRKLTWWIFYIEMVIVFSCFSHLIITKALLLVSYYLVLINRFCANSPSRPDKMLSQTRAKILFCLRLWDLTRLGKLPRSLYHTRLVWKLIFYSENTSSQLGLISFEVKLLR